MLGLIILALLSGTDMETENNAFGTFEFKDLKKQQFVIVNDGVMGGRSQSELSVLNKAASYSGEVSLENNGGFASVRMIWPFDFSKNNSAPSIAVLKVKGDGKTYQFRLRTNRGFDGAAYSYSFKTLANKEQTIYIPITDFVPTFRGRTLRNMPKLEFSDVQQMGVLVADYQVGAFKIDLIDLSLQ
jgi:hypothetical protein